MQVRTFKRRYSSSRRTYARRCRTRLFVVEALDKPQDHFVFGVTVGGNSIPTPVPAEYLITAARVLFRPRLSPIPELLQLAFYKMEL
jgi:hypothetical protein